MPSSQAFDDTLYGSQLPSVVAESDFSFNPVTGLASLESVNQQELYNPYPGIALAAPHTITNTAGPDRLTEASAFYRSKITAAEQLVILLESKLGEGKKGRSNGLNIETSDIDCVVCSSVSEGPARTRQPHKVCTAKLPPDHQFRLLSDIGSYFGYVPTVSVGVESKSCPLYRQISYINHKIVPSASQIKLNSGMDAKQVRAAERDPNHIETPVQEQLRQKGGVEKRQKAWVDYNLLNEIDLVKQYIEDCKTADRTLWGAQTVPSQASWFDQDLDSTGSGCDANNAWA